MVVAVVQSRDAEPCTGALTSAGHVCTRLASSGGFLDKGNATLVIGVEEAQVDAVIQILRSRAKRRSEFVAAPARVAVPGGAMMPPPLDVEIGGATVFVVDVDRFEKL